METFSSILALREGNPPVTGKCEQAVEKTVSTFHAGDLRLMGRHRNVQIMMTSQKFYPYIERHDF